MGAADRLRARLAEAEEADLACVDELPDRAGDLLDRHVGVDLVLVEDVDVTGPEVPQAVLGDLANVFGSAVEDRADLREVGQVEAELGGDGDLVAEVLDGAASPSTTSTSPAPS